MKKILIFLAFVFTVACYASPPPVPVPQFQTDELQCILQDNVQPIQVNTVENIQSVQYVANVNIGSYEMFAVNNPVAEEVAAVKLPAVVLIDTSYKGKYNLKKPPSDTRMNATNQINKQNSNYGYPFGADYFVLS